MKKYILIILILLSPLTAFLQADNLTSPLISIVPRPTQIVPGRGNFTFSAQTVFAVESQEQAVIARNFIDLFTRAAGITPALNVGREEGQVRFVTDSSLKSEAYWRLRRNRYSLKLRIQKAFSMPCNLSANFCRLP